MPEMTLPNEITPLEEQAMSIAAEIFNLTNQYTHDSNISKFFLSDEISKACYGLAGGFASVVYTPALDPTKIKDTAILSFYYALITYGFNIYLRERASLTKGKPYILPTDKIIIKKAQKKTLTITSKGQLQSTQLADKIIDILIDNTQTQVHTKEFALKNHRLNKKKMIDYAKLSLYWGYNFAKELLKSTTSTKGTTSFKNG